ncbi:hypothetical protein [Alloactinosynnema sp. L-07]|uniref:hypothetical protein n=1 Tax=Alloactinosynnema sp. L-07 TaxID=1653480 RepID=UPI00065F033A|nr:hypothetical protein [Alloactinosynnema sp. L-07]CRK59019.1 hypothetical protein [Alloactinosynnema sp. L-07]
MSAAITDLRLRPSVRFTDSTALVARAICLDCGTAEEVRDFDEGRAWEADHEGCPAVVDQAHGEALAIEAARASGALALRLISRSGLVHISSLHEVDSYLCDSRSPFIEHTALSSDCPSCGLHVSSMQDFAYRARHGAMQGYSAAAPMGARHWARLTAAEQARWLTWACSDNPEMPEIDEAADRVELEAVARWAADGIDIKVAVAQVLHETTGMDPAPTVQVPPVPDEARAAGWDALIAARDSGADLSQAYARALDAVLLPLYAAWVGDRHLMALPEPDEVDESGARWGQLVDATMYGSTPVVRLVGRAWTADDAELLAAEIVAAARWGRDRADELGADAVPLDVALAPYAARMDARRDARGADVEQSGGVS